MKGNKKITILLFLVIISSPVIIQLIGLRIGSENTENRQLTTKPKLTLKQTENAGSGAASILGFYRDVIDYKNRFDNYFKDNLILKPIFFKLFYTIKADFFAVNPLPHKVLEGTDGWMFLGDSYSSVVCESKALCTFSDGELSQVKNNLLERNEWLNERDIKYFIAIAPNKHSIYGDYLAIEKSHEKTKLEQLKAAAASTSLNLVDMAELINQHLDERLFLKTNTHWNDLGAFWGYKNLESRIKLFYPEVKSLPLDDFDLVTDTSYREDLTQMLNIDREEERYWLEYHYQEARPVPSKIAVPKNYFRGPDDYEERYESDANDIKVLVFRDSFGSALVKFLKENFGESVFIWRNNFDRALIEREQPDIVIQEVIERNIDVFLKE